MPWACPITGVLRLDAGGIRYVVSRVSTSERGCRSVKEIEVLVFRRRHVSSEVAKQCDRVFRSLANTTQLTQSDGTRP